MISENLFFNLSSKKIAEQIRKAQYSVCFAGPGIQLEPAQALAEKFSKGGTMDSVMFLIALPFASLLLALVFQGVVRLACGFVPGYWMAWKAVMAPTAIVIIAYAVAKAFGTNQTLTGIIFIAGLYVQVELYSSMVKDQFGPIGMKRALVAIAVQFLILFAISGLVIAIPLQSVPKRAVLIGVSLACYFSIYAIATRKSLAIKKEPSMYCSQCGAEISTGARFCQSCGAEFKSQPRYKDSNIEDGAILAPSKATKVLENSESTVASDTSEATIDQSKTYLGVIHHPWRRFFARTVDLLTLGVPILLLAAFLVGYLFPQNVNGFVKALENPITAGIILYLFWLPVEAGFLAVIGTTPAKWVFGISVVSNEGMKLSYASALQRSFLVWIQGEGLGIPLVTLFTRIFAYRRLTRTGTTLWDTSVGSVVKHKKWGAIRATASVLIVLVALMIMGILNSIGNA